MTLHRLVRIHVVFTVLGMDKMGITRHGTTVPLLQCHYRPLREDASATMNPRVVLAGIRVVTDRQVRPSATLLQAVCE
jgi:hypothetical protein